MSQSISSLWLIVRRLLFSRKELLAAPLVNICLHQPAPLSLVQECLGLALIGRECCWRQLSYAIKNQRGASKIPLGALDALDGSLWHKRAVASNTLDQ